MLSSVKVGSLFLVRFFVGSLFCCTFLSFFPAQHPAFDLIANLRIQGVLAILVFLAITIGLKDRRAMFSLAVLLLANLWGLRLAVTDGQSDAKLVRPIRVASLNVYSGNTDFDAIVENIRDTQADVVAIIELTPALAQHLEATIHDTYPHSALNSSAQGSFGIGIYSRYKIADAKSLSWQGSPKSMVCTIENYRIVAVHPLPPVSREGFQRRNQQLENVSQLIAESGHLPTICVGDFNLTPWSGTMRAFLRQTDLRRAGTGIEIAPTWYARDLFPMGLCIDHILISREIQCREFVIGDDCGSDHRSVTATIGLQ